MIPGFGNNGDGNDPDNNNGSDGVDDELHTKP